MAKKSTAGLRVQGAVPPKRRRAEIDLESKEAKVEVQGSRLNEGKPQLSYLFEFPHALEELCRVCEHGSQKYARGNWKGGLDDKEVQDSMMRHLMEGLSKPDVLVLDAESNRDVLAHALWNLLVLIEQRNNRGIIHKSTV